ncbi:hypothetical protein J6590_108227 [Homalodisca vitripennis]|nr:hypothetical protein J6590_108227 [Homalodisca vitripennis]
MLRNLPAGIKHDLLLLYNRIFIENKFPVSWRRSHVIALHKMGQDSTSPGSYRPISLTSSLCKTLERMVNRRLVWFLEKNNLLSAPQCGFRQGRSSTDHLITMETAILNAFIQRRQMTAVFFDLMKAYDTAWRRGIINTLVSWGIGNHMLAFINGFMMDRSIQVRLGKTLSDPFIQENGIPQGSVLSCTLFAIAINDIASCVAPPVHCSLFVDDFAIFVTAKRLSTTERALQLTINRLVKWCGRTGFTFSLPKTRCMVFSRLRSVDEPTLFLKGQRITPCEEIKFLGLTFDRRLTWISHLKNLKSKCLKRLNLIRALSGTTWGADRTCMLRFYKAFIRSCLDYGCQVYGSARPNALKMLDSIHNSSLRLATGALRSSPVISIYAETGEPPLSHRRVQLSLNYVHTLMSKPQNPAYDWVLNNSLHDQFITKPRHPAPIGVRAISYNSQIGLTDYEVRELHQCDVPPWSVTPPEIILSLSTFKKHTTPDTIYHQEFRQILQQLSPCDVIYTDGSKDGPRTGCAFVTAGRRYGFRLPSDSSVYTAELTAIQKTLNITWSRTGKLVICSDSLSSLQAIGDMYSKNILVRSIWSSLHKLQSEGVVVIFVWVPGHVGIHGNELADRGAKEALELQPFTLRMVASDITPVVKAKLKAMWSSEWQAVYNNKLRIIKDCTRPWGTAHRRSRREEVVLCRLRLGHTLLSHGFLMNRGDPPICATCDTVITVKHVLVDCPCYSRCRRAINLPASLRDVLGDDETVVRRLFAFLTASSLVSKI